MLSPSEGPHARRGGHGDRFLYGTSQGFAHILKGGVAQNLEILAQGIALDVLSETAAVLILAQGGVIGHIRKEGEMLVGSPVIPVKQYMKAYALFRRAARED